MKEIILIEGDYLWDNQGHHVCNNGFVEIVQSEQILHVEEDIFNRIYPIILNERKKRTTINDDENNQEENNREHNQENINKKQLLTSDDRLKFNEEYIENATNIIMKLKPQLYMKSSQLYELKNGIIESGLIAQELYYSIPELRHLIKIHDDAINVDVVPKDYNDTSNNPMIDPDYTNWGSEPAKIDYIGLIPYIIKHNQEQQNEIILLKKENQLLKEKIEHIEEILQYKLNTP
jgi:hypothetical protein